MSLRTLLFDRNSSDRRSPDAGRRACAPANAGFILSRWEARSKRAMDDLATARATPTQSTTSACAHDTACIDAQKKLRLAGDDARARDISHDALWRVDEDDRDSPPLPFEVGPALNA